MAAASTNQTGQQPASPALTPGATGATAEPAGPAQPASTEQPAGPAGPSGATLADEVRAERDRAGATRTARAAIAQQPTARPAGSADSTVDRR
ncbi:hypothetical protein MSS2_01843 [Mycobacterium marinum]|nr:hypothetical protein MSS2_01843 [Mycobacterium marinum]